MAQIYKIYVNQSALILTNFHKKSEYDLQVIDNKKFDLKSFFEDVSENNIAETFFLSAMVPRAVMMRLKRSVRFIRAAGGLVRNLDGDYLFIKRLGKWDLPKGKVEDEEKVKRAAVREVEEECGVEISAAGSKKASTYHVYSIDGEVVLKKTVWYIMTVEGRPPLVPQQEEDITEAVWVPVSKLSMVRENTYPLIFDLISDLEEEYP